MPEKRWSNLNPENVKREPTNRSAVYLLKNRKDQILYIGCGRVHASLSSHLSGEHIIEGATHYWYKKARNDQKAQEGYENFKTWFKDSMGDLPVGNGGAGALSSPSVEAPPELDTHEEVMEESTEEVEEAIEETEASDDEPQVVAEGLEDEENKED